MRNGRVSRFIRSKALGQPHTRRTHNRRRAFTLIEVLVATSILALIMTVAVGLITQWAFGNRALPVLAARQSSDAQVQQMVAELRDAIAVSYIASGEVVALINNNGSSGVTPTVNGVPTGSYFVAYAFTNGVLYRNGGPSATLSAPTAYNPSVSGAGSMPQPPAWVGPGQQPTCSSPCYNPSGAYAAYTNYHGSGNPTDGGGQIVGQGYYGRGYGWVNVPVYQGSAQGGNNGCSYYNLGGGTVNEFKLYIYYVGSQSRGYSLSNNPQARSQLGTNSQWCDFTRGGSMINGSNLAARVDRNGVSGIFYIPLQSTTAYYYLPSCGCYLSQSQYNADQANWNAYQQALAAWQAREAQNSQYPTQYGTYLQSVTAWNQANAQAINNLANQHPSTSGTATSGGWSQSSVWTIVADGLKSVVFTGYTQAGGATTTAAGVRTIGVAVQYPGAGSTAVQEQLTLGGTQAVVYTTTHPLTIPPEQPANGATATGMYNNWNANEGNGGFGSGHAAAAYDQGQAEIGSGSVEAPGPAGNRSGGQGNFGNISGGAYGGDYGGESSWP